MSIQHGIETRFFCSQACSAASRATRSAWALRRYKRGRRQAGILLLVCVSEQTTTAPHGQPRLCGSTGGAQAGGARVSKQQPHHAVHLGPAAVQGGRRQAGAVSIQRGVDTIGVFATRPAVQPACTPGTLTLNVPGPCGSTGGPQQHSSMSIGEICLSRATAPGVEPPPSPHYHNVQLALSTSGP